MPFPSAHAFASVRNAPANPGFHTTSFFPPSWTILEPAQNVFESASIRVAGIAKLHPREQHGGEAHVWLAMPDRDQLTKATSQAKFSAPRPQRSTTPAETRPSAQLITMRLANSAAKPSPRLSRLKPKNQ